MERGHCIMIKCQSITNIQQISMSMHEIIELFVQLKKINEQICNYSW
jgi:hypothetical protein